MMTSATTEATSLTGVQVGPTPGPSHRRRSTAAEQRRTRRAFQVVEFLRHFTSSIFAISAVSLLTGALRSCDNANRYTVRLPHPPPVELGGDNTKTLHRASAWRQAEEETKAMGRTVRCFPLGVGMLGVVAVMFTVTAPIRVNAQAVCGNGIVEPPETCDPPSSTPSTPIGNTNLCRLDCTYCGDGILNGPETCDTGGVPNRACNSNCTGRIAKDPGSIAFNVGGSGIDRLQVNGRITPPAPIDPSTLSVSVRLSNTNGLIYTTTLNAGALQPLGRKFKYRDRGAATGGGFSEFQFSPHKDGYRIKLAAYGDLSAATLADMTVEVDFGPGQYTNTATWKQTRRGWRNSDSGQP